MPLPEGVDPDLEVFPTIRLRGLKHCNESLLHTYLDPLMHQPVTMKRLHTHLAQATSRLHRMGVFRSVQALVDKSRDLSEVQVQLLVKEKRPERGLSSTINRRGHLELGLFASTPYLLASSLWSAVADFRYAGFSQTRELNVKARRADVFGPNNPLWNLELGLLGDAKDLRDIGSRREEFFGALGTLSSGDGRHTVAMDLGVRDLRPEMGASLAVKECDMRTLRCGLKYTGSLGAFSRFYDGFTAFPIHGQKLTYGVDLGGLWGGSARTFKCGVNAQCVREIGNSGLAVSLVGGAGLVGTWATLFKTPAALLQTDDSTQADFSPLVTPIQDRFFSGDFLRGFKRNMVGLSEERELQNEAVALQWTNSGPQGGLPLLKDYLGGDAVVALGLELSAPVPYVKAALEKLEASEEYERVASVLSGLKSARCVAYWQGLALLPPGNSTTPPLAFGSSLTDVAAETLDSLRSVVGVAVQIPIFSPCA